MQIRNRPSRAYSQQPLKRHTYDNFTVYRNQVTLHREVTAADRSFKMKKPRLILILVLALAITGHIAWSKHVSAETAAARQAQLVASAEAQRKGQVFDSQINSLLAANPNDLISVATASTDRGLQTYGSTSVFDGASTAKLLTAADFLHHVEQGTASLNQQIDGHSADYWLKIMLVNSDDTAWSELNGFLTHPDLAAYAGSINFNDYDPSTNTFTAGDTALLLQKLYSGGLLNSADRSLFLRYLGEANYRQYIVAAVPGSDEVYHKVGIDDDTLNDAAIINNGQKYLVLVIFTDGQGSYDTANRTAIIHSITKDAIAAYL